MTDENQTPDQDDTDKQPKPGPTKRLDKAIEDMESGDYDGTLVDISAGTGEVPKLNDPDDASVSKELKKQKGAGGARTPNVEPAATMYEPTKGGQVTGGSNQATMYQPTGAGEHQRPPSGQTQSPSGTGYDPQPVAPFGGKIMVGTRVGQIEVTGVLGKGGMGEVFRGYHHALDIEVAIKVLPDELSRNELVRQRFLREARLCVKLDHPHIVRVYNVDEYAGNLFLVMEMIEGADAADMLKDGGRFKYKRALEIGAAGADALAYAQAQGLVHRDVKPHNILLGAKDGKIKLSDFGLARAATSSSHLTMSGQIMGTPHYMSPEQAESKEVTDKSDVYSLGVTLYHMLTGETPFVGDTPISVAVQHIAKEIIFPELRFKPFPKELVAVLKRMTAKDADKRCSAKQASVWLRKLISMASDEDVQVDDEQAMKSMAPVVRESQAFQQAIKAREKRDNQAREMAQTMLATVQEQSARRAGVPQTMQEGGSDQTQQAPQPSGSGGKIAAALFVLLLLGGGAAGWYFTMGPGAGQFGGQSNNVVADDDSGDGNADGNADGDATDGSADTGGETGSETGAETGTETDGEIGPPPVHDDPTVAAKLETADAGISAANSLAEIKQAKKSLDLASMELGNASASQRESFKQLEAKYDRQFAFFAVDDAGQRIRQSLEAFDAADVDDRAGAIQHLNAAIAARTDLRNLKVPPEAVEIVGDNRESAITEVTEAVDGYWDALDTEAARLEGKEQYDESVKILEDMARINSDAETQTPLLKRLSLVWTRAKHKSIRARLDLEKYHEAVALLSETETRGVPEELKSEHASVANEVAKRIASVLNARLDAAYAALDTDDFTTARNELEAAGELPLNGDQAAKVADQTFATNLREQLYDATESIKGNNFNAARESLNSANTMIEGAENRAVPEALTNMYAAAVENFDASLKLRFEELMASAQSDVEQKDFVSAGENLTMADDLPLTDPQRQELEQFKKSNQEALDNYVRDLITEFETALDEDDFETAKTRLDTINSLPTPPDMAEKLSKLQARFATDAANRHTELVDEARTALDKKGYGEARAALDKAAAIPVDEPARSKEAALDEEWLRLLTSDVDALLKGADALLQEAKFGSAKAEIEKAATFPLTEDLNRRVKRKLASWNESLENHFIGLLSQASDNSDAGLFRTAQAQLDDAEALPLSQEQLIRLSTAQDELNTAIDAHKDALFKELKGCVAKGLEEQGKQIVKKLEAFALGAGEQLRIKRLKAALTGETDSDRRARLPDHLKPMFNDRYCESEQLIQIGEEITALNVTNDGKFGAVGTESGKVYFYNLKRGTRVGASSGGRRQITTITLSPDGSIAVSGNDDGDLVRFSIEGTKVSTKSLGNAGDDVMGMGFAPNGNVLYVATLDGRLHRYNPKTSADIGKTNTGLDGAECLAISPDGKWVAVGGDDAKIALFNSSSMTLQKSLQAPGDDVIQSVAFSADSKKLIGGSIGDDVGVWELDRLTEKPRKQLEGLSEWVRGVGFGPDGHRCAGFDNEYKLVVWKTGAGMALKEYSFESKLKGKKEFWATAGVIGPDGTILIGTREGELVHLSLPKVQ